MDELKEKIGSAVQSRMDRWFPEFKNRAPAVDIGAAALTAIEEAGYVVFPKEAIEKMVREHDAERTDLIGRLFTALGATFVPSSPSYFDRADSATSFDPEKQFEKDREEGR